MVAVINSHNQILLVRQRGAAQWGLPGGFAKRAETLELAAGRELREETGLNAEIFEEHLVTTYKQPWVRHFDTVFQIFVAKDCQRTHTAEIAECEWFALCELPALTQEAAYGMRLLGPHSNERSV
jgi:8-oxo-dGTP diphosphatase